MLTLWLLDPEKGDGEDKAREMQREEEACNGAHISDYAYIHTHTRVSQPWHYWHFGTSNSLLLEPLLCIVGYSAVYLVSTHWVL